MSEASWQALCRSADLRNSATAVPVDVVYQGQTCRAFAIRFAGEVHAYLNRCGHIPMEMDLQLNHFFDSSGQWLVCATHGAVYQPQTGACQGGPCRAGLVKIALLEHDGVVHWRTEHNLKPLNF